MSGDTDSLSKLLTQFDMSEDEGKLYIYSLKEDRITALQASKDLKIARTKVYRLLEKLIERGIMIEEVRDYGTKFRAQSPEKFLEIMHQKEKELLMLKSTTPTLVNQLASLQSLIGPDSKILNYRGAEGLKQVTWNSTKTKGDFRIYEISSLHSMVDYEFAEKARQEFAKKPQNSFYQLTNETSFEDFTLITQHIEQWNVRHVPKSVLNIQFEVHIYNDVYCMLDYKDDDVFIVEIYNQKLADMQKQIFDVVWNSAQEMKIVSKRGKAKLAGKDSIKVK